MNEIQVLVCSGTILLLLISSFLYAIRSVGNKADYLVIFIIGAVGWTVAYLLRLVPLIVIQDIVATLTKNLVLITIWGPLFAALFEESIRFICLVICNSFRKDRKRLPFISGLGWTSAEILLLYILNIVIGNFLLSFPEAPLGYVFIGLVERIIASVFHITASYIVFYAIFERPFSKKFSLWLAMGFHFISNFFIIIWLVLFGNPSTWSLELSWLLEGAFGVIVLVMVLFTWKYWIPTRKPIQDVIECSQCGNFNSQVNFCVYCGAQLKYIKDSKELERD